jgi:hypothetical protein
MAFGTYQDLIDGVTSWINREDPETLARVPDFIVFGENRIFRQLRARFNEATTTYLATSADNSAGITLPTGFKEVKLITYDGRKMTRKSEQFVYEREPSNTAQQEPRYFYREGDTLKFFPPPDANADVALTYYEHQGNISGTLVPALYVEAPELYLWAALLESAPFLKFDERVPVWEAKFNEVLGELMDDSWQAEFAGSTVSVSNVYTDGRGRDQVGGT